MSIKILVVDDHPDIRRIISLAVSDKFNIIEAKDALSGWMQVKNELPHLVILDVMMPGELDGFDLLRLIKTHPDYSSIKVLMLSCCSDKPHISLAAKFQADKYITKPFSPMRLLEIIDVIMD